ncbi:hypothetical protein MML48_2g00008998 [Holotrichia oblita]|uniref:Uncharacterized protein n=1 Tax=Holotrichia oblita TaxID=644536 RepID=A0ACB9TMY6_HOLOL|nr:hypothetical protein MML48_2g00008998 [Holotrichia oblita]
MQVMRDNNDTTHFLWLGEIFQSGRQSYGDNAIGYVRLKQTEALCELKAKITPEHKIKSRNYNVSRAINTTEKVVVNAKCHDCPASEEGCKHEVAFLMWLHRRSAEPSSTETSCYWKKSKLSSAPNFHNVTKMSDFIIASCVVHNLCIDMGDTVELEEMQDDEGTADQILDAELQLKRLGEIKRNYYSEMLDI